MAGQKSQQDRVVRSLKRLGFQLHKSGKAFKVIDGAGVPALGSQPIMTIAEVEHWIGDHIKPKS